MNRSKVIFAIITLLFPFSFLMSQTYVSGFISSDETWTTAGSPYIVNGNALVSQGVTLTINPGVVVKFDADKAIQIDGELIAIGTPSNRIVFTSNQSTHTIGYWAKIHFSDNSVDAVYDVNGNYVSGSIMKYCDIEYGGGSGSGIVNIVNSSPFFNNCRFSKSSGSGVYSQGSSCKITSCVADSCSEYGIFFSQLNLSSCGINIENDSIIFNNLGGLYIGQGIPAYPTIIKNNYFTENSGYGAIYFGNSIIDNNHDVEISGNNFYHNTSSSLTACLFIGGNNVIIKNNLFEENNTSASEKSIIYIYGVNDTIKCNRFLSNHTGTNGKGVIDMWVSNSSVDNNFFHKNTNYGSYGVVVTNVRGSSSTSPITFTNNIITNNVSSSGICCKFNQDSYVPYTVEINNNDFSNNSVQDVVLITASTLTTNSTLNFNYNNFINPNSVFEFTNNLPSGSPTVNLSNNYWGGSNTQHINSVIYDYFDNSNYSTVNYTPVLLNPVIIDTSCSSGIPVFNQFINNDKVNGIFPNPFSDNTRLIVNEELSNAELVIYNSTGSLIKKMYGLVGKEVIIESGDLKPGIYYIILTERNKQIYCGKAIVLN